MSVRHKPFTDILSKNKQNLKKLFKRPPNQALGPPLVEISVYASFRFHWDQTRSHWLTPKSFFFTFNTN
ncbi:hypothetical protein HanHA300_Chr03g0076591 [Helianthus annuus]|nr:hypothetical protein HanHA300_Chr03g0076591 [Helianthus annuus]